MFALRASCCLVGLALAGLPACSGDENSPTGDVNKPTWDGGEDGVAPDSSSPDASDAPGDSEATDASEEGGGGSACGFAPSEVAGSPSPSGQTHVLHEVHGMAQNQLAVDHVLPVFGDPGVLARGACGTVGVLLFDDGAMSYVDLTGAPSDPVVVEPQASGFDASLMYDDACTPWVLRASSGGYVAYHPDDEGVWSSVPIEVNWDALLGVPLTGFSHVWGGRAADGKLHLVASARTSDAAFFVRGSRVATAGGTWSFEVVPTVGAEQIETVRVAPDGKLHALYTRTEYPCDPCNLDLYHGVFDGGAWVEDTVQASVWGPPEDQFATAPSIAFDAAGGAWVVATFQVRAVTGSLISSELRVYGKAGGGWCHERIVADSDGYAGTDGTVFTGAQPAVEVDGAGRLHVVFTDEAQWHGSNGWANNVQGQVRYGVRSGSEWLVVTLFEQPGPTESAKPLHGFDGPLLNVAADGASARVVGTEWVWETDSVYNDQEVPITLRARSMGVSAASP